MPTSKHTFAAIVIGLSALLLIVIVSVVMRPPTEMEEPTEGGSLGLRIGKNAIYVAEQAPGSEIVVSLAALETSGYVVIHEADAEGNPGAVIGVSALLTEGEHQMVEIRTSRPMVDGEELIGMLHADNGNGTYDNESTDAAIIERGEPVWMIFSVVEGAEEAQPIIL